MKILTKLTITNFMSYPSAEVFFRPGLNVIGGANRSGKTNLLRAINWVLFNKGVHFSTEEADDELRHVGPQGKADNARVVLLFSDGWELERFRSGAENSYRIRRPDGTEEVYHGPGIGFFEPAGEASGIFPVDVGGDSEQVGFQGVHDPEFLVCEGGARLDNRLTRMSGSNILEDAAAAASNDANALKSKARGERAEADKLQAALLPYAELDVAIADQEAVTNAVLRLRDSGLMLSNAQQAAGRLAIAQAAADHARGAREQLTVGAQQATGLLERAEGSLSVLASAAGASGELRAANQTLQVLGASREALEGGSLPATAAIQRLEGSAAALAAARAAVTEFTVADSALTAARAASQAALTGSAAAEQELQAAVATLDICPHCGRPDKCPHCGQGITI